MDFPPEISYRGVERSDALQELVEARVAKLERLFDHVVGVRVAVERASGRKGIESYRVRVEVSVPNQKIVAVHDDGGLDEHERLYRAVRDAFDKVGRQLQDYKRTLPGEQLRQGVGEQPPHGIVARVFPYEGYGFISTNDGRELYFHENAVIETTLDRLEPGTEVRYAEAEDHVQGPHASTVHVVGKTGHQIDLP